MEQAVDVGASLRAGCVETGDLRSGLRLGQETGRNVYGGSVRRPAATGLETHPLILMPEYRPRSARETVLLGRQTGIVPLSPPPRPDCQSDGHQFSAGDAIRCASSSQHQNPPRFDGFVSPTRQP